MNKKLKTSTYNKLDQLLGNLPRNNNCFKWKNKQNNYVTLT